MREDAEPRAQRHLCHLPVPPFPPVASGGCLPSAPPVFLLLCSFHVNLLIYPAPKTVSELPGGAVCGVTAWPLGEHWADAACQEPSAPLALSSSSSWL